MLERTRAGTFIRARDTVTFATAFAEYSEGPPGLKPGERNPYGLDLESRMRTGRPGIDTVKTYRDHAERFVLPEFGNVLLPQIDAAEVKRYAYHLATRYKWSYVKPGLNVIREVLQHAVERRPRWLPRNPLRDEPIPPPLHAKFRTVKTPTIEQVRQLVYAVAEGPRIGDYLPNVLPGLAVQLRSVCSPCESASRPG